MLPAKPMTRPRFAQHPPQGGLAGTGKWLLYWLMALSKGRAPPTLSVRKGSTGMGGIALRANGETPHLVCGVSYKAVSTKFFMRQAETG